jgi:hypothetical protein
MSRFHSLLLATALVGVGAQTARAQADDPAPPTGDAAAAPAAISEAHDTDGFVLPKGKLQLDALMEISLSSGGVFKPFSITPDLWYGATDDLTVGLVHSTLGETGFIGGVSNSLCFSGSGNGCPELYNNVGADARYRLKKPFSLDAGLYANAFSPSFFLDLKIGIDGRWVWGKLSLEVQANLFFGLTNRNPAKDPTTMKDIGNGNREVLFIPATIAYLVIPKLDLGLQTGLDLPFNNTGDAYEIPFALFGKYAATPKLGLGLALAFPRLLGGASTGDIRSLTLGGTYAF